MNNIDNSSINTLPGEMFAQLKYPYDEYSISNYGRLISFKCSNPRILKWQTSSSGDLMSTIRSRGTAKKVHASRLVAENFVPNPYHHHYVMFMDGNKSNVNYTNLLWANYQTTHPSNYSRQAKQIICLETHQIYRSQYQLAKHLNVSFTLVRNKLKTHQLLKGYHYQYYLSDKPLYKLVEFNNGKIGCIYGGPNKKYYDMIDILGSSDITRFGYTFHDYDEADKVRTKLNHVGYCFEIVGCVI